MNRAGDLVRKPTDLRLRSWRDVFKRTIGEFREKGLTDWAASLTYYGVLSIFPAVIALVSILGLLGESATSAVLDQINELAPGSARDILTGAVEEVTESQGTAGLVFFLGLLGALWTASGYVGGFTKASNVVYEVEEGRPFWRLRPIQVGITLVMILLLAFAALAVVTTGPIADEVGDLIGVGGTALTVWDIAKWPVLVLIVLGIIAVLYHAAPNVRQPSFRWITPGGVLALALWILASLAFAAYVANFGSYGETYGSLAGVVVFLVWLWITNLAVLLGLTLNAELERARELEAGVPLDETLAMEPRQAADGADAARDKAEREDLAHSHE